MKKYIVSGLLLFSIMAPVSVLAQADIDPNEEVSSCVSLQSTNLRYKSRDANTNGEVSDLQDFLQDQGFLRGTIDGRFGLGTLKAVKAFQSANGLKPTGYVGSVTRAKINAISCGVSTNTPVPVASNPITTPTSTKPDFTPFEITFPDRSMDLFEGQTYTITWEEGLNHAYQVTPYNIYLAEFKYSVVPTHRRLIHLGKVDSMARKFVWTVPSNLPDITTYSYSILIRKGVDSPTNLTGNYSPTLYILPASTTTTHTTPPMFDAPTVDLKVNGLNGPVNVSKGGSMQVSYTSTDADTCYLKGDAWANDTLTTLEGSYFRPIEGLTTNYKFNVIPDTAGAYTISCSRSGSVATDTVLVSLFTPNTPTSSLNITTPSTLPDAKVGRNYYVDLYTSGTDLSNTYSWSVNGGAAGFPVTGLGFGSSNEHFNSIRGTPAKVYIGGVEQTVPYIFTFDVTFNYGSQTVTKPFTLNVYPEVAIPSETKTLSFSASPTTVVLGRYASDPSPKTTLKVLASNIDKNCVITGPFDTMPYLTNGQVGSPTGPSSATIYFSPDSFGNISGYADIPLRQTSTYTVTCSTGNSGYFSKSVTVYVAAPKVSFLDSKSLTANALGAVSSATSSAISTNIKIGDKVKVKNVNYLNVRANAGGVGSVLGAQSNGASGLVLDGPVTIEGQNWWKIDYTYSQDGWSIEKYLELVR